MRWPWRSGRLMTRAAGATAGTEPLPALAVLTDAAVLPVAAEMVGVSFSGAGLLGLRTDALARSTAVRPQALAEARWSSCAITPIGNRLCPRKAAISMFQSGASSGFVASMTTDWKSVGVGKR